MIDPPIDGDFDINGWDLGKALKLMLKGNAVILEWLQSPIAYEVDAEFRDAFLELAQRYADRQAIGMHYLRLGERQWRTYFGDGEGEVAIKKVFYALRPAAALRWMELHGDRAVPPMNFLTLMAESQPPAAVAELVSDLLRRKAVTRELGQARIPSILAEYITGQYDRATRWLETEPRRPRSSATEEVDRFFRDYVQRYSGVTD